MITSQDIVELAERRTTAKEAYEAARAQRGSIIPGSKQRGMTVGELRDYEAAEAEVDKARAEYVAYDHAVSYAVHARVMMVRSEEYRALYERREELAGLPLWYKRTLKRLQDIAPSVSYADAQSDSVYIRVDCGATSEREILYLGTDKNPDTGAWELGRSYLAPACKWPDPTDYTGPQTIAECVSLARARPGVAKKIDDARTAIRRVLDVLDKPYLLVGDSLM